MKRILSKLLVCLLIFNSACTFDSKKVNASTINYESLYSIEKGCNYIAIYETGKFRRNYTCRLVVKNGEVSCTDGGGIGNNFFYSVYRNLLPNTTYTLNIYSNDDLNTVVYSKEYVTDAFDSSSAGIATPKCSLRVSTVRTNKKIYIDYCISNSQVLNIGDKIETRLYDAKNNKLLKKKTSKVDTDIEKSKGTYSLKATYNDEFNGYSTKANFFYITVRIIRTIGNEKYYSDFSKKEYFCAPAMMKIKNTIVSKNSITLNWKKVSKAKKYVLYVSRGNYKTGKEKTYRINVNKKTRYTIKKLGGKKINTNKYYYSIQLYCEAKLKGRTYKTQKGNKIGFRYFASKYKKKITAVQPWG